MRTLRSASCRIPLLVGIIVASAPLARTNAAAQPTWDRAVSTSLTRERVIGLLSLASLVGGGCGPANPISIDMYEEPSIASRRIGWFEYLVSDRAPDGASCGATQLTVHLDGGRPAEELPSEEMDYEVKAAVVYERAGEWFRIALQRGSAWIKRDNANGFAPYPELLQEKLSYLREEWDSRLWREPSVGSGTSIPTSWREAFGRDVSVAVLGFRRVHGELWVQVRIQTDVCGKRFEGVTPMTGWVPAYLLNGAPALWFSSRGC